jgi:sulfur carrier protein
VKISVNGETRDVPDGATVEALLRELGLFGRPLAVERNREIVPRSAHAATPLAEGDKIEVVTMVGGG